jgi:hypothetical protein
VRDVRFVKYSTLHCERQLWMQQDDALESFQKLV